MIRRFYSRREKTWWDEWQKRLMRAYGVTSQGSRVYEDEKEGRPDGDNRADVER